MARRWLWEKVHPEHQVLREGSTVPGVPVDEYFPQPITLRQQWILGLGAILSRSNGENLTLRLHPDQAVRQQESPAFHRHSLERAWEITDRASLVRQVVALLERGHRATLAAGVGHPPLAWDYARVVNITRWGFAAGFVDEPTGWTLLEAVVAPVGNTYGSWGSFGRDYLLGRTAWRGKRDPDMEQTVLSLWAPSLRLLSPWQLVPWEAWR